MEDFSIFLGRFHPLVVHLPIGIIMFAAILELISVFRREKRFQKTILIALYFGGIFGLLSAGIGYMLSLSGGYDESTLSWHKWLGFVLSFGAIVLAILKQKSDWNFRFKQIDISQIGIVVLVILLSITGHLGGNLTHGHTYLTEYMPQPLKSLITSDLSEHDIAELPTTIDSVQVFSHLINPILTEKCTKCHNPTKEKGALDLTSIVGIEKGGSSGAAFIAGQAHESEVLKRVLLPKSSKKFMPPGGNEALSPIEISIIKWWVKNGANYEQSFNDFPEDENMKFMLSAYLGFDEKEESKEIVLPDVAQLDTTIIAELERLKVNVNRITQESNLLDISFTKAQKEGRENLTNQFTLLQKLAKNIYKLDLSNCGLEDQDLGILKQMKHLTFLRLERNNISDKGIQQLVSMENLRYLNLYANPLTDETINGIKQLSGLRKLNVWQTSITTSALDQLLASNPSLEVISN